jgi:hypothetical protein
VSLWEFQVFGDVNPSGKLPISFPKQIADLPTANIQQFPGVDDRDGDGHQHRHPGGRRRRPAQRRAEPAGVVPAHPAGHRALDRSWTTNAGQYRVYLGDSSRNVPLSAAPTVS